VIFELRLARIASRTAGMYRIGTTVLVPVREFCELAEMQCTVDSLGAVRGTLEPGSVPFVVTASGELASVGEKKVAIPRLESLVADGERYLSTTVLAALFDTPFLVQTSDLLVSVPEIAGLPLGQRLAREARRRTLRRAQAGPAPPDSVTPQGRPLFDGAVVDYTVQATSTAFGAQAGGTLALGTHVLGGALTTAWTRNAFLGASPQPFRASWLGVWHDQPWLRQLRVGDASGTGPSPRFTRGFAATNTPYLRPQLLGAVGFGGTLPDGWTVEAYQGDRLVGFDTLAGRQRWDMTLPVSFGENLLDFVAIGPYGATRRFTRAYRVLTDMIPARTVEYGVSAGECVLLSCRLSQNADLRWGVSSRLTVRAGYDGFTRDPLPTLSHPYVGASATWGDAVSATVLAQASATSRLTLGYEPSFTQRYFITASVSDPTVRQPLLAAPNERRRLGVTALWRSADQQDRFFVQFNAFRAEATTNSFSQARLAVSAQQAQWRLTPFVRADLAEFGAASQQTTFFGTEYFATLSRRAGRVLAGSLIRGVAERDASGQRGQVGAFLGQLFQGWLRAEIGVTWIAGATPIWVLTVNGDRARVRTLTTASAARGAPGAVAQTVQGSMVLDRRGSRVDFWRGPAIERAGLTGRVFTDVDGDGRFGPGDEPVSDAFVRAGGLAARTDSSGRYRLWDLVPFDPVIAEVDLGTVPSPLLVSRTGRVQVTPEPHRYTPLDLVLEVGGTIEGRVEQRTGGRAYGLGGVPLLLTRTGDDTTRTVLTFTDGDFAAFSLRPGTWRVEVAPTFLKQAKLTAQPVELTLARSTDGSVSPTITLRLRPEPLTDSDADGVPDDDDECPSSSPGAVVDVRGCGEPPPPPPPPPADSDGDGVADGTDRCPGTPLGTSVDASGCRALFSDTTTAVVLRGVTFAKNRAVLTGESFAVLDEVAAALLRAPALRIEIGGHTDSAGSAVANRRLSLARAEVVRFYLARRGVLPDRLVAKGYGAERPVAPNSTAQGRARNRRTELTRLEAPPR
jgi:outer membrane protein OmpA-like peptidoglycan-associated protein